MAGGFCLDPRGQQLDGAPRFDSFLASLTSIKYQFELLMLLNLKYLWTRLSSMPES